MATSDPLPDVVEDHGDHLHVPARRPGVAWISAVLLLVLGHALAILGPGDLGQAPVVRTGLAFAAVVLAGLLVGIGTMRSWFDASLVGRRSLFGRRTLPWPEVTGVQLAERVEHTPLGGLTHRLPGGLTITAGPGSGGRRGPGGRHAGPRLWRPTRVVEVRMRAGRREVAVPLEGADLAEAEALLDELTDRGWLSADVPCEVVGADR